MQATESEAVPNVDAAAAEYPTPPDLHAADWSALIRTAAVTAPNLFAKLDSPTQCSSTHSHGPQSARVVPAQRSSAFPRTATACGGFYRRATWAPDGSCILAISETQQKHILRCSSSGVIHHSANLNSPSPLLDAIWYPVPALDQPHPSLAGVSPTATSTATATWCFAESHRDLPVRLTASSGGHSRASYSIMNHVEKFVGPHSLAFSPDLSRLYCGLYSSLAVLPLSRPGLNTHAHVPLISSKRSSGGQRGIISALATATHPTDAAHELVAVGTFNGTVGIYSFDSDSFPEPVEHTITHAASSPGEQTLAQSSCLAGWREIEGDGITQLKFHPLLPFVVFVASRRSDFIYVYDVRYLIGDMSRWSFRPLPHAAAGVRSAHLLAKLWRPAGESHQRIYFDVDWAGRWLASGDENGMIRLWRIDTGRFLDHIDRHDQDHPESEPLELEPDLSWSAHQDAVGSVSFHPYQPWLASVSGSRRWPDTADASGSESEGGHETNASSRSSASDDACSREQQAWTTSDSSIKIWDFSQPPTPRTSS